MYIAPKQRQITPRDIIFMSNEFFCHYGQLMQVWKKALWNVILYIFFIHVGSLRTGADHLFGTGFWCRMKPVVTVAIWCKFRKQIWLNCDFLHVHNPGARADKPLGTEFWCRMKAFAMMANWWKFINKISVNCDLVHFFFSWLHTCT